MRRNVGRREFLTAGALVGGALVIGFRVAARGPRGREGSEAGASFTPNAFLRVAADGSVTVVIDKSEMGQGVVTSLAMLVAEELECPMRSVRTEFAPVDSRYNRLFAGAQVTAFGHLPETGAQGTGGSSSVQSSWLPLRRAGAAAREMLISAAAQRWGVDRGECSTRDGEVVHGRSGRRLACRR